MTAPQYESRNGLRVPIPEPATGRALDLRPRRIQEWIQELPLADAHESGRQLLALVRAANVTAMEPVARQRFAESVQDTVAQIGRALMKAVSNRGFPLTGKSLEQSDLCTALQRAMADTHKLVAVHVLESGRGHRKLLATAVQQAVMQLSRLLLDHYAQYAPAPDGLWLDLHRLHRIAEDQELLAPASSSRRAPPGARIGELYRQCLLTSLANPYRLHRGELGRVVTLSSALAHRMVLSPDPTPRSGFQLHSQQDRPPVPRHQQHDTGGVRYLDLSAVVDTLQQADASADPSELQLRRRLLAAWRQRPRRGFKRISQSGDIRVGVGLETAYHLLERDLPAEPVIPVQPLTPALGVVPPLESMTAPRDEPALYDFRTADDQARFYPGGGRRQAEPAYPLPGLAMPPPQYRDHAWRTVDVSARGCCLRWNSDRPSPARVGEVVMLRETEAGGWSAGVVRWMQYDREQGLKLGVEILAPGALPVTTRSTMRKPSETSQDPALRLPAVPAAGQPASLIVASATHNVGETLDVLQRGKPQRVRLVDELERNGSFAQFVFEMQPGTDDPAGPAA